MILGAKYKKNDIGHKITLAEDWPEIGYITGILGSHIELTQEKHHSNIIPESLFASCYDLIEEPQYETIQVFVIDNELFFLDRQKTMLERMIGAKTGSDISKD